MLIVVHLNATLESPANAAQGCTSDIATNAEIHFVGFHGGGGGASSSSSCRPSSPCLHLTTLPASEEMRLGLDSGSDDASQRRDADPEKGRSIPVEGHLTSEKQRCPSEIH